MLSGSTTVTGCIHQTSLTSESKFNHIGRRDNNSSLTENPLLNISQSKAAKTLCTAYYVLHRNIYASCYFTIELIPSTSRAVMSLATIVPELPNNNFGKRVI